MRKAQMLALRVAGEREEIIKGDGKMRHAGLVRACDTTKVLGVVYKARRQSYDL